MYDFDSYRTLMTMYDASNLPEEIVFRLRLRGQFRKYALTLQGGTLVLAFDNSNSIAKAKRQYSLDHWLLPREGKSINEPNPGYMRNCSSNTLVLNGADTTSVTC